MGIVTCKKCKKSFDDDLKYESNILKPSSQDRCSYHGSHIGGINSGHSESLHTSKYEVKDSNSIEKEKIARKLKEKYAHNPPTHSIWLYWVC